MSPIKTLSLTTALILAGVLTGCAAQETASSTATADAEIATAVSLSSIDVTSSGATVLSALQASHDDARALLEEGIEIAALPILPEDIN